ncbi:MAG TPA: hypothetical protein VHM19_02970, partial [Polyangiales bacterium]|nr:hypothetical protein [Polyangiales bacterium]
YVLPSIARLAAMGSVAWQIALPKTTEKLLSLAFDDDGTAFVLHEAYDGDMTIFEIAANGTSCKSHPLSLQTPAIPSTLRSAAGELYVSWDGALGHLKRQ